MTQKFPQLMPKSKDIFLQCEGCPGQITKEIKEAKKVHEDSMMINTWLWADGWNGGVSGEPDMCPECSEGFKDDFKPGWKEDY